MTIRRRAHGRPDETRERLLKAAERAFNTEGYWGTDTNRIARRAGFAPQTFYRHFADKTAIFLAVYERWWRGEMEALASARGKRAAFGAAARVAFAFHSRWRIFRRALRHLAVEDARVRAARAAARKAQIARMKALSGIARSDAEWSAALLAAERLCDAAAEGEFADLGISRKAALDAIARAMVTLVGR